ncbi:glutamine-hydrolyzing carbamoyl-phosphate synthase small subunit [Buchnera aphidicola]|uniref:Carbamoyl phosphate synthase small chain n=1 Tax=Buchnera aphidicola (Anoecia oenotherae) TaxID=1241833 RepID=A0A4D6XUU9_9GAMM|nr:glutamine-hydrolyzing carbamoyl-phosphate synthase small subunit [Buchnera aphidicola]QCI19249.1 carbamoyl-phosphate synthase small subunit [Buchnera aphidicola (Anoecia oenotherae)]
MVKSAVLVLEDGTSFYGKCIGIQGFSVGEVVFNTSMTGYQEILTDPSYFKQIITFTYPHIGNVGVNTKDEESMKIYATGMIIREQSIIPSNYRSEMSLPDYLKKHRIIAISGIDTRKLTLLIRKNGTQNGCIMSLNIGNYNDAYRLAKSFRGIENTNLADMITTRHKYYWNTTVNKNINEKKSTCIERKFFVVVYDFGVKKSILRILHNKNCILLIVPSYAHYSDVLKLKPDGIFLSNGPGDPRPCIYVINTIKKFLKKNIPIFGICFGYQLLALASGAKIIKMKYGHHGGNHPVKNITDNTVYITSQNHNFSVDRNSINSNIKITHISLFDKTIQGIAIKDKKAFGFQGHPESSPGPQDIVRLFDKFINLMNT